MKISDGCVAPQKTLCPISMLFLTENLRAQKNGRELVFSADLCYNGDNDKASPLGRGGGEADGEG